MRLSVCCGWQSVPPTLPEDYPASRTIRRPARTHIAAALGLAMLLACSLASRPTQAHPAAGTSSRWPSSRGPSWASPLPKHAARHARHAAARVQPRVQARQPPRQPWQNPCGTSVAVAPIATPARHPRPNRTNNAARTQDLDWASPSMDGGKGWSLRTVRRRIRIARAHLRHRRKHIHQVYGSVKVLRNKYSFDWLPQEQVPWYRAEITCLDRDAQAALVLPALRSALQNFSATFVELQKARRWTIDSPGLSNRSLIIGELANHVKGMLCEVETAMQERSLSLPAAGLPPDGLAGVEPSRWNPDPDQTGALIQDWGVVSAYTDALFGWALILRELGHAHKVRRGDPPPAPLGPGGCPAQPAPHRLHGRFRNPLRRKQRRHPGGGGGGGGAVAQAAPKAVAKGAKAAAKPGAKGAKGQEARRRRRRRRKQRERRRRRRRLMEEMAKRNGGRPWPPRPSPKPSPHRKHPGRNPGRPGRHPHAARPPRTPTEP